MAMKRDIGLVGLTFIAVGGVLGSAWLFVPLLAVQVAGPAALLAWLIGAVAMLVLALTFAEITTMFPVAGGIARIPQFSHGRLLAMCLGWSAWAGYCTTAPIEVEATLRYAAPYLPWIHDGSSGGLTLAGLAVAAVLLLTFTIVNAFGVAWLASINTTLTWAKVIIPAVFIVAIIAARFEPSNFVDHGGFAPYGISGIFAAVASGGVAFALIGFRHAIDMAGETRDPHRTIPLALVLAVLICLVIYGGLQTAFIGGQTEENLAKGWASIDANHTLGPLGALATALGTLWLVSLLNAAAVISPLGGALVAVTSNGRLAMAMANNGVFPSIIAKLNQRGVPLGALVLNYIVALVLLVTMPFEEIVALNGSAIVLSFVAAPVGVVALRLLAPDFKRPLRLPAVQVVGLFGFIIATLMVYWSGWDTMWRLFVLLLVGLVLFGVRLMALGWEELSPRGALWLVPYLAGLAVVSALGGYGGGLGWIPHPFDSLLVAALSVGVFLFGVRCRLPKEEFERFIREEELLEREEYGEGGATALR